MADVKLYLGDCLDIMRGMDAESVDSIVTDPPYGLSFMGKDWDHGVPGIAYWKEALRVAKPGTWLLAFGGTRTFHRLICAIEDAGWEIRDTIMWVYGSGFPKSHNVGKAIDKRRDDYPAIKSVVMYLREKAEKAGYNADTINKSLGWGSAVAQHLLAPSRSNAICPTWEQWLELKKLLNFNGELDDEIWRLNGRKGKPGEAWYEREVVGKQIRPSGRQFAEGMSGFAKGEVDITAPATPEAQQWDGWGTALKPAWEPVIVARKPIPGTVAENVLQYGTGAMNIDGCRVGTDEVENGRGGRQARDTQTYGRYEGQESKSFVSGRWPANVIHDGSDEVLALFPQSQSSDRVRNNSRSWGDGNIYGTGNPTQTGGFNDSGSAARFFYCAKASKADRDEGCEGLEVRNAYEHDGRKALNVEKRLDGSTRQETRSKNHHPTVKPEPLMRYLCKLVTPPGGVVFDPFMGSGSTGKAAVKEGFAFIGCDNEPEYIQIAECRIPKEVTIQTEMGF